MNYIVCGYKSWNREAFDGTISHFPGRWVYIDSPQELSLASIQLLKPRYIFFLHWSWKVPKEITDSLECVNFHIGDLPFGRGGSPLQNLILRGVQNTQVSAFRMTEELDAGPVYLKSPLSLEGSAQEIYIGATQIAAQMILEIIQKEPKPFAQEGAAVVFKRRRPEESRIEKIDSPKKLYDFIRMLDAQGYPKAFIEEGSLRYEFSQASLKEDCVEAKVVITPKGVKS